MTKKLLLMMLGLLLTANILYSSNLLENKTNNDYIGNYTSPIMTMIIKGRDGGFEGTVTYNKNNYPFTAHFSSGFLKGKYVDNKKLEFSAKFGKDNRLIFTTSDFNVRMTKEQENIGLVAHKLNDLDSKLYKETDNNYLSSLTLNGGKHYNNSINMQLTYIAPGSFMTEEKTSEDTLTTNHKETITKPFLIGRYEVTQFEYQKVMKSNPSNFSGNSNPVEEVTWHEAVNFCNKLTSLERSNGKLKMGYVYRLPTQTEWEFAAKGGNKSKGYIYSGSNDLNLVAWYDENSNNETHSVGQKPGNELGLHDMTGNVWEWCSDLAKLDISSELRACRGGSFIGTPKLCNLSYAFYLPSNLNFPALGIRVVLVSE